MCLFCLLTLAAAEFASQNATVAPTESVSPTNTELEVWGWNIAAASLTQLIPAFNKSRPDIHVNVVMSGTQMESRFLLAMIAGVGAPDVSQLQTYDAPRFSPSGKLMDLTGLAQKYEKQFSPAFWATCLYEGRVYAVPWDMGPCAVYYKRNLFTRYGVNTDSIETWADYIRAGKRILEASGGKTKMLNLSLNGLFDFYEILMQQNGGGIFDNDGALILNSQANREVLGVIRAILDSGIAAPVNPFTHEYFASIKTDAIATYPIAVWFGGSIKDYGPETSGNWGVFRLPAMRQGGLRTSNLGGSVLVIPEQCKHKEAAWAFVEYALCTPEGQLEQYRKFDLFPCLMTTFSDPFFDEPDPFYGGQKVRRLFATDIEKIPYMNRTRDWVEAKRYITQGLSSWANDRMDADVFLSSMQERLSRTLGRPIASEIPATAP